MAQDLQEKDNRLHRLFEKFSNESKTISIASVSLIISVLALLMSWMAVYDALHVKALLESEIRMSGQSYEQLEREYRLLQAKVDRHRAAMLAAGIDPDFHN